MNGEFNDASIEQIKQKLDQRGLPQEFSKNILSVDQAFNNLLSTQLTQL
jgi:hypothetical protein